MGKLLNVMDKVRWCRGQLSAESVNHKDYYMNSVGHYATTMEEYVTIGGQVSRFDGQGNLCGAACSLGIIHMAMGNLLEHDDGRYSWNNERDDKWFKWALTKWAVQISQFVFQAWYKLNYDLETRQRLGYAYDTPSIIEWNDNEATKRDDVYKFMSILEQDLTLVKLFKLAELTPPAQRVKFELFKEMHPLEKIADCQYSWDELTNDDVMLIARELMPVQNLPIKLSVS